MQELNLKKVNNRYVIEEKDNDNSLSFYKYDERVDTYNLLLKRNNKAYFFKGNGKHSLDVPELIVSALAKEVDLNFVMQYPAVFIDKNGKQIFGVISEDYVENRQKTEVFNFTKVYRDYIKSLGINQKDYDEFMLKKIYMRANSIESTFKGIKHLVRDLDARHNFKLEIAKNLSQEIKKQHIFNFAILNEDFHSHNIEGCVTDGKTLSLAPSMDFGYSLLIKSFSSKIRDNFSSIEKADAVRQIKNDARNANCPFAVFEPVNISEILKDFNRVQDKNSREKVAKDLTYLIEQNDELKDFYNKLIKVNLKEVLKNYIQENNYDFIADSDIEIAHLAFEASKEQLREAMMAQEIISKSPMSILRKISGQHPLETVLE